MTEFLKLIGKLQQDQLVKWVTDNPQFNIATNGQTLLFLSIDKNFEILFDTLLAKGVDINSTTLKNGDSALMHTAYKNTGHMSLLVKLLKKGANINHKNKSGATVLTYAISNSYVASVEAICLEAKSLEQIEEFRQQIKNIRFNHFASVLLNKIESEIKGFS